LSFKICPFLLPFYETKNLIFGTSNPTSNLYFLQIWKIDPVLIESMKDEVNIIKAMTTNMMLKFEKYWHDYSVVIALGVVLPICIARMRYNFNELHCYFLQVHQHKIKHQRRSKMASERNVDLYTKLWRKICV
jgi:hypothetical protein